MSQRHAFRGRGKSTANALAREALLAEVATLYYVDHFTQEDIARQIGRSVATVSRLLAKAHETEVVEVRVRYPVPVVPALQAALVSRFGLRSARVARTVPDDPAGSRPQISDLAARYISTLLHDGTVIATSWGSTVLGVIQSIAPGQQRDLHVVQGLGSLGSRMPTIDNPLLVRMLAERLDATPHYLPAPMIVDSVSVRDALTRDPYFRSTLDLCGRADIALIGIGAADMDQSSAVRAGYLAQSELEEVLARGAVGEFVVEFYDRYGRILQTEFGSRVMGMRQGELRNAGTVIAVAGGVSKGPAILGALRTGLIHVLVTDNETAQHVLELDETMPAPGPAHIVAPERVIASLVPWSIVDGESQASTPDTDLAVRNRNEYGELRQELVSILEQATLRIASEHVESQFEAAVRDGYRKLHASWHDPLVALIERGKAQGELATDASADTLADMVLGALWIRSLLRDAPPDAALISELIAAVLDRDHRADAKS